MEYGVVDNKGKIIAWIDTNTNKQLIHKDFILEQGEHLPAIEIDGEMKPVIEVQF